MKRYYISLVLIIFLIFGFSSVANATEEMTGYDSTYTDGETTYYVYNGDDGFSYMTNPSLDYYIINGYSNSENTSTTLTVPSSYNGLPVKEIWYSAFRSATFEEIIIPDSVTKLYNEVFADSAIKTITIPSSVTEMGSFMFAGTTNLKEVIIPDSVIKIEGGGTFFDSNVETVVFGTGITTIGSYEFKNCENLKSITFKGEIESIGAEAFYYTVLDVFEIPSTVKTIDSKAFYYTKIQKVIFPDADHVITFSDNSVSPFSQSTTKEIVIGTSLKVIPANFLYGSYNIKTVVINEGIEEIGENAFGWNSLQSITIPSTLKKIATRAFYCAGMYIYTESPVVDLILPEGVTAIGDEAFSSSRMFRKIVLPSTLTDIGEYVFQYSAVQEVSVSGEIGEIPNNFFNKAYYLKNINIENGITKIGDYSFADLDKLESITLPESLEYIGNYAFLNTNIPDSVVIPQNVTYIGENAFQGLAYKSAGLEDSFSAKNIIVNGNITRLEYAAFANQVDLKTIALPETVEFIDENVFANCLSLTEIKVPSKVTMISSNTFTNCINLKTVSLPDGLTTINSEAFNQCISLESITIPASVTTIDASSFTNCDSLTTIYGIKGSVAETFAKENNLKFVGSTITVIETEEAKNEEGQIVTVMPITKDNTIDNFVSTENFPGLADGTNEAVIKDADGNIKSASDGIGSKNVIQIVDKTTGSVIAEYTVVVRGDITGEGKARIFDAYEILKDSIIKTATDYPEIDIMIRDYDGDGKVRIFDAYSYLRDSIL